MKFNNDAAAWLGEKAQEILQAIQGFGVPPPSPGASLLPDLHVSEVIGQDQILSAQRFYYEVNRIGQPCAVIWLSQGNRVGWRDEGFQKIRNLAENMARRGPAKGLISDEFALEVTCTWLVETLERERSDSLSAYFENRCNEEVREHHIWIPLFRTYSTSVFRIET